MAFSDTWGVGGSGWDEVTVSQNSKDRSPPKTIETNKDIRRSYGMECDQGIINAMTAAWQRAGIGFNQQEAGFIVFGNADGSYGIQVLPNTNQNGSIRFDLPDGAIAIFHTHPNSGLPQPSGNDANIVDQLRLGSLQMFTITHDGLWQYDSMPNVSRQLVGGTGWMKQCQ
jgi:hypothetical protein